MIHPVYFSYTKNVRLYRDPALQLLVSQHQKPLAGSVCACVCVLILMKVRFAVRFAPDLILSLKNVLLCTFFIIIYVCVVFVTL